MTLPPSKKNSPTGTARPKNTPGSSSLPENHWGVPSLPPRRQSASHVSTKPKALIHGDGNTREENHLSSERQHRAHTSRPHPSHGEKNPLPLDGQPKKRGRVFPRPVFSNKNTTHSKESKGSKQNCTEHYNDKRPPDAPLGAEMLWENAPPLPPRNKIAEISYAEGARDCDKHRSPRENQRAHSARGNLRGGVVKKNRPGERSGSSWPQKKRVHRSAEEKSLDGYKKQNPYFSAPDVAMLSLGRDPKIPRLIVFEGGEGVGKSTQAQRLCHHLNTNGISCYLTRQPGGSALGSRIRSLIFDARLDPIEELLLLLADRHYHLRQCIEPRLAKGQWVICDRYWDSSFVYQGLKIGNAPAYPSALETGNNLDPKIDTSNSALDPKNLEEAPGRTQQPCLSSASQSFIRHLHSVVGIERIPDITILLQDSVDKALKRRLSRPEKCNKFDYATVEYHQKISNAYEQLVAENPERYLCLPAQSSREKATKILFDALHQRFSEIPPA